MNILKNKHLILAMFVAPILAIIAYFSVDHVVSEEPHAAMQGSSYRLAAKSNCRYQSGVCTLKNGDIEVTIRAHRLSDEAVELSLHSELAIQQAVISYVVDDSAVAPVMMRANSAENKDWLVRLYLDEPEKSKIRLALNIAESSYYAETSAIFIDYKTSFSRENFPE